MTSAEFQRVLTCFADKAANVDITKGTFLAEIRNQVITGKLQTRPSGLVVKIDDVEYNATDWLIKEIAQMPLLADRIIAYIEPEPNFVEPSIIISGTHGNQDISADAQMAASDAIPRILDNRVGGSSSIFYLISDAGEGKTTLINYLALNQAKKYKNKEADWLLVPIPLGGKSFIRLEDMVVAFMMNKLKFPYLYYDAFIELVRLGAIMPALDGFEELFVLNASGEATTGLSSIVQKMKSEGTLLVSARKAYFEYRGLEFPAQLYDSIKDYDVTFAKISLVRWDKEQFLSYCKKIGMENGEQIYDSFSKKMGKDHPLLTRAILVRKLLQVIVAGENYEDVLSPLSTEGDLWFSQFVDALLHREATEKWINVDGDPPGPLLSLGEHHQLLGLIAQTMWEADALILAADVVDFIAELFSEKLQKTISIRRQIKEKIKSHALLIKSNTTEEYLFDHEEFYHYFLGEALATSILLAEMPEIRRMLRNKVLPERAVSICAMYLNLSPEKINGVIATLSDATAREDSSSFGKENAGAIIMRTLHNRSDLKVIISNMTFPINALEKAHLKNIIFKDCYFQQSGLALIENCVFDACHFERIDFLESTKIIRTQLKKPKIRAACNSDDQIFEPEKALALAIKNGFEVEQEISDEAKREIENDEDLVITQRALKIYFQTTQINEETFRERLRSKGGYFVQKIVPVLEKNNILIRTIYKGGGGSQKRYALNVKMADIQGALISCQGSFDKFVAKLAR